jgi:hypothetical protein
LGTAGGKSLGKRGGIKNLPSEPGKDQKIYLPSNFGLILASNDGMFSMGIKDIRSVLKRWQPVEASLSYPGRLPVIDQIPDGLMFGLPRYPTAIRLQVSWKHKFLHRYVWLAV